MAEKRCLQIMGRVCDVVDIPQSRMATATSGPSVRDIWETGNQPRGFDQSAMLISYRVCDCVFYFLKYSKYVMPKHLMCFLVFVL